MRRSPPMRQWKQTIQGHCPTCGRQRGRGLYCPLCHTFRGYLRQVSSYRFACRVCAGTHSSGLMRRLDEVPIAASDYHTRRYCPTCRSYGFTLQPTADAL